MKKRKQLLLVSGGAGYVGTELTKLLLKNNYYVTVYDLFIYGENLLKSYVGQNLNLIRGDIRDLSKLKKVLNNFDFVIHLACISNDPSFDLDPKLGKSINYDPFEALVKISKESADKNEKKYLDG